MLYIGGKSETDNRIFSLTPVNAFYDTVITTQADFEEWCAQLDAGTFGGHSVLILNGIYTRSDGKGLHLPETLKQLHGLGTVQINITNFESNNYNNNRAGIWYSNVPTTEEYSIRNISVDCKGAFYDLSAFNSCTNLINCTGSCTIIKTVTPINHFASGFRLCTNLINCAGMGTNSASSSNDMIAYGFVSCDNLVNCKGIGNGINSSHGFNNCNYLINCKGSGSQDYDFNNCAFCSNCNSIYSNVNARWGGTSRYISKDTCPGYTG